MDTLLSKYTVIKKKIGKGSFGKISLIKENSSENEYALKSIDLGKMSKVKHQEPSLLTNELHIHQCLEHPHIIRQVEYFQNHSSVFIVLEHAPQGDLFHLMQN